MEKIIQETFLPSVFFGKSKSLPPIVETLIITPVNKYLLYLQYPVKSSNKKYLILLRVSIEMIGAVTGERKISTANHLLTLREERHDGQKIQDGTNNIKLKGLVKDLE